jgi:hypothetical protein
MKTPMQQMLELLEELLDSKPTRADRTRFETAIAKAKELIQEEKETIITAFDLGLDDIDYRFDPKRAERYYYETFGYEDND